MLQDITDQAERYYDGETRLQAYRRHQVRERNRSLRAKTKEMLKVAKSVQIEAIAKASFSIWEQKMNEIAQQDIKRI